MINTFPQHASLSVSSTINTAIFLQKAEDLAGKLQLDFASSLEQITNDIALCYTEEGLKLIHRPVKGKRYGVLLFVDFVYGKSGYRLARNRTTRQPLARAVGIKPGFRPTVYDATAGLGQDGFVLASLGCRVTLVERSPVIFSLLEDGIQRAKENPKTSSIANNNIQLIHLDSTDFLRSTEESFHTVYLDPMYPHRKGSALGKQTLRVIRSLVGDDLDSADLMKAAVDKNVSRIVVKRPKNAPALSASPPNHIISGKSSRYDIYFDQK